MMKTKSKLISQIFVLTILIGAVFSASPCAFADTGSPATEVNTPSDNSLIAETVAAFVYQHDPMDNPEAMKDIVRDESAIYGFRPSDSGSLKQYAEMDWFDSELVAKGREERVAYHNSIAVMYETLSRMTEEGKSAEEIARTLSKMRNDIRIESYKDDPEGLATMKQRNLERYGHEEGPLPEELYEQYGSWEKVTEKAFSCNVGMDACLGLYDDYYFLYVALGQVGDDTVQLLGGEVTVLDATCIQRKLADLVNETFNESSADADEDGEVTILDAAAIQRWLASLPSNDSIGKPIA